MSIKERDKVTNFNNKKYNMTIKMFIAMVTFISSLLFIGCSENNTVIDRFKPNYFADKESESYAFYGEEVSPEREKELLAENTIYFAYDSDEITHRYQLVLLAHAKQMLDKPHLTLRINGHTDERGSAEYNIGLGERRAKAVARFIEMRGIRMKRLVTVSYGKEKPAAIGSNEEAWRLNRRAELNYEE